MNIHDIARTRYDLKLLYAPLQNFICKARPQTEKCGGLKDDDARINPNGGAIALGHPLGVSGTRIIQTAAIELQKRNKKYALITMCIGVGQGYATIIEKV